MYLRCIPLCYHFYCKLASSRFRDSRVHEIEESPNTNIKPATIPLFLYHALIFSRAFHFRVTPTIRGPGTG